LPELKNLKNYTTKQQGECKMPSIKGALTVTNKDWKYVYNSILNFVNEEIDNAKSKAVTFYSDIKDKKCSKNFVIDNFNELISKYQPSTYQKVLIKSSLFSGTNNYIYAPKKNNFKKFTNRTAYINIESVIIDIDKKSCTLSLDTENFVNFDQYIVENTFISEFINMVNTIPWPTRSGPNKAIRGCKLLSVEGDSATIFYKSGPRPPTLSTDLKINDTTMDEPSHLASRLIKSIRYVSTGAEETIQPIPTSIENNFDD
jgi:hypothetical protein